MATSDNHNRTLTEVRNIMDKHEGKLGAAGAVGYMFKKCSLIIFNKQDVKEEVMFEAAEHLEAFDIDQDDTHFYVWFPYENLGHIKDKLGDLKYESAEVDFKPQTIIELNDPAKMQRVENLINLLEELEDVHKVFANL